MSGEERRAGARFITEMSVVLSPSSGGTPFDDRATAHDVSTKGFKVETQSPLKQGALVAFSLELPMGARASGKGRVVWSNRETFATWAGVEIVSMPWGDRRRLGGYLNPEQTDWSRLSGLGVRLVMALTVVAAAHRVFHSAQLRALLVQLAPKALALLVMGWAFLGLLKRERR